MTVPSYQPAPLELEEFKRLALFAGLPEETLERFLSTLKPRSLPAGEVVFRQGDAARALYVVIEGELEKSTRGEGARDCRVALLGPDDTFGELSVLDMQPRTTTVRALSQVRLIEVSGEALDDLYRHDVRAYALLVLNLARDVTRRLRVADGLVASFASTLADVYPHRSRR